MSTRSSIASLALAMTLLVCGSRTTAGAVPKPIALVPFTQNGTLIALTVRVNASSKPLRFTLDSGASRCVLDSHTARVLGLHVHDRGRGHGAGTGTFAYALISHLMFAVGDAVFRAPDTYAIDLANTGTQRPEDGLIGFDFFTKYVVRIDYRKRLLTLYDPHTYHYSGSGSVLPILLRRRVPYITVPIKVQGRSPELRTLLVDSGSEDAVDDAIIARSTAPKRTVGAGVGLGARYSALLGPIQTVRFGRFLVKDIQGVSSGVSIVGSAVLRRFTVIFDYAHKSMVFEQE